MFAWRSFLGLFTAFHLTTGTWEGATGIKYFLATCGRQSCDAVCATFGFRCAKTGQSFPASSALPIFESLGISCKTLNYTDSYVYKDNPNYVAEWPYNKDWIGLCIGFKGIPSTIDCHTANNTYIRRLCPCFDPFATQAPVPSSPKLSSIIPSTSHDPGHKPPAADHDQQRGTRGGADRTALIAVAVIAAGLALCLLGLAVILMWNKKKFSQKQDTEETHGQKLHVTYNKSNEETPDMIDGLTVETEIDEENSYCDMKPADRSLRESRETKLKNFTLEEESRYANMADKSTNNMLYASITEEQNTSLVAGNNNQLYERLA